MRHALPEAARAVKCGDDGVGMPAKAVLRACLNAFLAAFLLLE
jgi:hypothetical protein